jgi:predicted amidohydrolase YtcJ
LQDDNAAELIITGGKMATMDERNHFVTAVAIKDGRFVMAGDDKSALEYMGAHTKLIELNGQTVIPGMTDTHMHFVREGLNYNMELRWDSVTSVAEGMRRVGEQAARTPAPNWVRVVGGWSEFQFEEARVPTLEELNRIAPKTPAMILHVYHDAILNQAALDAVGYGKDTPDPEAAEIERGPDGKPTGMLVAKPNASILYGTLAKAPKLSYDDRVNSTLQFQRELNRFGLTGVVDAAGGSQFYPEDYAVASKLAKEKRLTIRTSYNLFTQRPKHELEDYQKWSKMVKPGDGDDFFRVNGAGETLVFSAADYENFLEPRPDLAKTMEGDLTAVAGFLVQSRWPFRLHATYDESITRFLDVFEAINDKSPFDGLRWFLDHAETISDKSLQRVKALGGGISVQDRMAYQGEHFIESYGEEAAERSPPMARMIKMGIPVAGGTDATRVASYDPWVSIYWMVTGKTVGGTQLYGSDNILDRGQALRLMTSASPWFSGESGKKGTIEVGRLADLAVLSADYFTVDEEEVKGLESLLTVVGGRPVFGQGTFESLAPPAIPFSPDWSPVRTYGGYVSSPGRVGSDQRNHDHRAPKVDSENGTLRPKVFGDSC